MINNVELSESQLNVEYSLVESPFSRENDEQPYRHDDPSLIPVSPDHPLRNESISFSPHTPHASTSRSSQRVFK
jgi:hypothetical protein